MPCSPQRTANLEAVFDRIQHQRMAGIPLLHPGLRVQAVGFTDWRQRCLGVLITPWFMNLILLPGPADRWDERPVGSKHTHTLPSGDYEFILAREDGIGPYQMCSLFSPLLEFEDQQAAVATATAVMTGIMDAANRDPVSTREDEIRAIWSPEAPPPATGEDTAQPESEAAMDRPMSRRDLLRGAFLRSGK